jgi:hypothetical protein
VVVIEPTGDQLASDFGDIEHLSKADAQAMREIAETMIQAYCGDDDDLYIGLLDEDEQL